MIQAANAWDVLVFPNGHRRYRMQTDTAKLTHDVQIHAVGTPDYKTEVRIMREQVKEYMKGLQDFAAFESYTPCTGEGGPDGWCDHDGEDGFR